MARPDRYDHIDFVPPASVAAEAERGMKLRREFKRGGTRVALARARDLKNRRNLTPETIKRMVSYFDNHSSDAKSLNFGSDDDPSPEYVNWLLWGGDAGRDWGRRIIAQMSSADRDSREGRSAA
jgi:hypothetical protein